jgi:hypothetical protein
MKLIMIGPGMYTQQPSPCDTCNAEGVIFE